MEMESTRRSFDRSISKEPGLKKPRLSEGHGAPPPPHRGSGDRAGAIQRSMFSNTGGGSRAQRDQDSESIDPLRVPYQPQPGNQLHQELVDQYKLALSELTFNSKPIITNLTIIAGENLHSAKAIATTVCCNILEVPREQKLPSLYLLDSIVKNIGRDYIKYFASRLPEVFCKTYRQADPSIHQGMRHLFGTWKGVFPLHILQMIEKELAFATTANGSSSGKTVSRSDSQAQRPAHSIHVNPKYLEARQRLQTTRARGSGNDTGSVVSTHEDVEASGRTTPISSERLSGYARSVHPQHKDKVNAAVHVQSSSKPYLESEYGLCLGARKVNDKEQGLDLSWCESGSNAPGKVINMKNGLHVQFSHQSAKSNSHLQLKQNYASRNCHGDIQSWKNSEEEEYTWDGTIARPTNHRADTLSKNDLTTDSIEKSDVDIDIHLPQRLHNIGSGVPDEASVDSISGIHVPFSLPGEQHQSEGDIYLDPGQNISSYTQGYSSELRNLSGSGVARKPSQSQQSHPLIGGVAQGIKVSVTQQTLGAVSAQSGRHPRPSSPSFPTLNQKKIQNDSTDRKQTSTGLPKDPRKPPRQKNAVSYDQVVQDLQPLSSRDVHKASTKVPAQSLQTSSGSAVIHSLQQRKNLPSQKRKLEESSDDDKLSVAPSSGLGNCLTKGNSSPVQSSPLINDSSATAAVKSRKLGSISLKGGLPKLGGPELGFRSSSQGTSSSLPSSSSPGLVSSHLLSNGSIHLPGPSVMLSEPASLPPDSPLSSLVGTQSEQESGVANSASDPFSSLLNSLMAKGLISSSKSDSPSSASTQKSNQPPSSKCPEVSNICSSPESSVPLTTGKPVLSVPDETSALKPAANASDGLVQSSKEKKFFIGFEFRSDIIRTLHSDVLDDLLIDLPYECNTCGLRLKLQESFDRHMEWHSLRIQENSRRWYTNVDSWTDRVGYILSKESPLDLLAESDSPLESNDPMVPADESQCACILCGELFDDFYCRERGEWMFKGAVYLSDPSSEFPEMIVPKSDMDCMHPIVHANCLTQDINQDLGLT